MLPFKGSAIEKELQGKFTIKKFSAKFYSKEGGNNTFLPIRVPARSVTICILFPKAAFCVSLQMCKIMLPDNCLGRVQISEVSQVNYC